MGKSAFCARQDTSFGVWIKGKDTRNLQYMYVGYPFLGSTCNLTPFPTPNGAPLDNTINMILHELVEKFVSPPSIGRTDPKRTATSPWHVAFQDDKMYQPSDKCSNMFTNLVKNSAGNYYNLQLGSYQFVVQPVWDPQMRMCTIGGRVAGTCGARDVGNGYCADPTLACSHAGYCGVGVDYAAPKGTCGGGNRGNGYCPNQRDSCSEWGYCGQTDAFKLNDGTCGDGVRLGNALCRVAGECCSVSTKLCSAANC